MLWQNIEQSSLTNKMTLLVIYFKYSIVYINLKLPVYPSPLPFSPGNHKFNIY